MAGRVCLALAVLAISSGCGTGNQGTMAQRWDRPSEAFVSDFKGTVEFSRGGADWSAAVPGLPVRPGTTLRTGADSSVDLLFGNGAGTVRLKPRSTITLERYDVAHRDGQRYGTVEMFLAEGDVEEPRKSSGGLVIVIKTAGGSRLLR